MSTLSNIQDQTIQLPDQVAPTPDQPVQLSNDRIRGGNGIQFLAYLFFIAGIVIAANNSTWSLAIGMGALSLGIFFIIKTFLSSWKSYGASICLGLLSSQLAFQWQDSKYANILFFTAAASLIFFNDPKVFIPIVVIFLVHQLFFYFLITGQHENTDLKLTLLYSGLFLIQVGLSAAFLFRTHALAEEKALLEKKFALQRANLEQNITYAKQIASGNFESAVTTSEDDVLGQSLGEMSRNLRLAAEENKNRNWTMAGIAKIAEIIRVSNHNMEDLANQLVSYVVKYLNASQGGIFVLNDTNPDNKFLELKGCYAYDRRKFQEKQVELGEGLVGQTVLEKETVYLTSIPHDYLNITSGLGESNPNALIIVPLKTEEDVVGAIEIASFRKFEDHQREFLEKVSENIASSIIFSKNHDQTTKLLQESQSLTEQMRAQEEEMRQNMEELQATQEDLQRKNIEMENAQKELSKERYLMEALMKGTTDCIYFKDLKSSFIRVSNTMGVIFKVNNVSEMVGKSDFDFFTKEHAQPAYEGEQQIIRTGKPIIDLVEKETWEDGRESFVSTSKMPLHDQNNNVVGTFGISRDVTKAKLAEADLLKKEKLFSVILKNSSEVYFILNQKGRIQYQSSSLLDLEEKNVKNASLFEIVNKEDSASLEKAFAELTNSTKSSIQTTFRYKRKNGEWISLQASLENYLNDENINGFIIVARQA